MENKLREVLKAEGIGENPYLHPQKPKPEDYFPMPDDYIPAVIRGGIACFPYIESRDKDSPIRFPAKDITEGQRADLWREYLRTFDDFDSVNSEGSPYDEWFSAGKINKWMIAGERYISDPYHAAQARTNRFRHLVLKRMEPLSSELFIQYTIETGRGKTNVTSEENSFEAMIQVARHLWELAGFEVAYVGRYSMDQLSQ